MLRTSGGARLGPLEHVQDLGGKQHGEPLEVVVVPTSKEERPIWLASSSAPHAADWPRLTKARGSLEHNQALIEAPGEPAGRGLMHLAFHIGWVLGGIAGEGSLALDRSRLDAYVEYMLGVEVSQRLRPIRPPARPASARSSSGRPLASANWQMCSGWLAVPSHTWYRLWLEHARCREAPWQ